MKTPLAGISDLIKSGCEIKSAPQGGKKFTVLPQKETMAYAREFSSLIIRAAAPSTDLA